MQSLARRRRRRRRARARARRRPPAARRCRRRAHARAPASSLPPLHAAAPTAPRDEPLVTDLGGPRRVSAASRPCRPHCTPARPPNCRAHPPGWADQALTSPRRLGPADVPLPARTRADDRGSPCLPVRPTPTMTWTGGGNPKRAGTARTPRQPATVHVASSRRRSPLHRSPPPHLHRLRHLHRRL
jgi:hypothetical protein